MCLKPNTGRNGSDRMFSPKEKAGGRSSTFCSSSISLNNPEYKGGSMKYLEKVERVIVVFLLVMMVLVVFLSAVDLGWLMIRDIITPPLFLLDINELLEVFGMFLLVLIGIELLETVKMYLLKNMVHVEVVFTVAMIAIARKVVILDIKEVSSLTLIGMGVIVIALSAGYYLLRTKQNR
jgi:uncharacterized membrane protein (DUF373 family)